MCNLRRIFGILARICSTKTKKAESLTYKQSAKLAIILIVLLTICFSGFAAAADYDLVQDNYIDCSDLAAFAAKWLADCSVHDCYSADLYNDNTVDFIDFALLAQHWRTIPEPNLIGWWRFDEGSGSVVTDSSGKSHDGTIIGAEWADGKIGKSLYFRGGGRCVTIDPAAISPLAGGSQVTVTLWQYGDIDQPQNTTAFQATYSFNPDDRVIGAQIAWYGEVYWDTVNAGNWDRLIKSAHSNEYKGQWNHWAFTKDADAGEMKIYLNGSLWASAAGKYNPLSNAKYFNIGSNIYGQENYGGRIDDFRIYNTTLSEDKIKAIYSRNKATNPYPFDGGVVWDSEVVLSWEPAPDAVQHDVYLGTNFADVNGANAGVYNPNGVYKGRQIGNSYNTTTNDPCGLEPNTTYYWRIDEISGYNRYRGDIWNFMFQTEIDFYKWGAETLQQIEDDLREPGSELYAEYAHILGGQSQTAYIWPQGIQFHALNNAAEVDPNNYLDKLKRFVEELHSRYWVYRNGLWGYDSSVTGGDRYYDDNAWIVMAYMKLYELTDYNSVYLQRAKDTMFFVMSGENEEPQSGIAWVEGSVGTKVCSTAPAIVGNLLLYKAHDGEIDEYLHDALRLYNWITNPGIGIQDDETGLFHQGCDEYLNVEWGYRAYQTAVPLRACLLFYEILGDESYLIEAQRLAGSMENRWVDMYGAFSETGQWGGFDMVEAYVDLYNVDSNSHWLDIVSAALYFLHANCKDPNGRYPEYWDTFQTDEIQIVHLLYQAPVATAYWKAASVME